MERGPHLLLEGILIGAWATGAEKTFIYVRGEYAEPARQLQRAIDEAYARGFLGANVMGTRLPTRRGADARRGRLHLRRGDGAARVARGQEGPAAQEAALPGAVRRLRHADHRQQRGDLLPRAAHPAQRGAAWFKGFGTDKSPGTTIFGVSGHVIRPGLYELPLGTKLDAIIFEHAGGVAGGRKVKGVIPGGMSMPILPAGHARRADGERVPARAQDHARHRRHHGDGRDHLHGARRLRDLVLLPRRVVRPVHAVPRGHGLDEQGAEPHRARRRQLRRPRPAARRRRQDGGRRRSAPSPTPRPGRCRACCGTSASDFEAHVALGRCPFPESFAL